MEKIHAACTMDWSIQLEKGLRSKKPGEPVEAIIQIGHRLNQWNVEPQLSKVAYDMFDLMPREDRLFANTIILRLTDAFRLGDTSIKLSVVGVFLSEFRHRKKRNNKNLGILSKSMVENPHELLSRVKTVFDTGDVQSRSLCLILFGCWADFAKENTDIRYLILMSLASSDVVEAKASIFAAGCFCDLVEDFAFVFLEMLMDIVTSSNTADAVRLAGVRAISKIGYSLSVADTAYKLGKKFVLESSEEEFLTAMLISLTKLASRWPLLVSDQAKLLLSYMTHGAALKLQSTATRCLCRIFAKGAGHCIVSADMMKSLICFIDEPQISSSTQFEVLWILHQVLVYTSPNLFNTDADKMSKLLMIIESASLSPFRANRHLAMRIYINIAGKLRGISENHSEGMLYDSLTKVVTLIIKKLTSVLKQIVDSGETQVVQESQYLFNLLICLVEEHSDLCVSVLDNMQSLIEAMITVYDRAMPTMRSCSLDHINSKFKKNTSTQLKFVIYLFRFLVVLIDILNKTGATSTEIFQKVKLLVSHVQKSSSLDWYTHSLYSLLLHSYIVWDYVTIETPGTCTPDGYLSRSNLVEQENLSLLCVKKMLVHKDNWSTYKTGLLAACQGSWMMADSIFKQLTTKVQSKSCYHWLTFLTQFAHSEKELQYLLLPKLSSILISMVEDSKNISMSSRNDYNKNLVSAYCTIHSSREASEPLVASSEGFYFQTWLSNIRFDVLETVLNILEILNNFSFSKDKIDVQSPEKSKQVNSLVIFLSQRSYRLTRLARQCDLIVSSFVGMHRKSLEVISALALSCEVLAFSTGFACLISDVSPSETKTQKGLEKPEYISPSMVIQSLITRLTHVDHETCLKLKCLLEDTGESQRRVQILCRNQVSCEASELREIIRVCKSAVDGASYLQREAKSVQSNKRLLINAKSGLQLLANTVRKWTHVPFCTPKSFFKLRPCIGSELFANNNDLGNSDSISVLPGFHLSLNICLQLKNLPSDFDIKQNKLYCILYCKASYATPSSSKENKGQTWLGHRGWDADAMLDLNDKLLHYATEREKKSSWKHRLDSDEDVGAAKAFVTIEANEGGQGFSTCLLDVSSFPCGSYQIQWLSCCIDSQGLYWSFLPLNASPVFTVQKSPTLK